MDWIIYFFRISSRTCTKMTHRNPFARIVNSDRIVRKKKEKKLFDERRTYTMKGTHTEQCVLWIHTIIIKCAVLFTETLCCAVYSPIVQVYMTSTVHMNVVVRVPWLLIAQSDEIFFFSSVFASTPQLCLYWFARKTDNKSRIYGKNANTQRTTENENKSMQWYWFFYTVHICRCYTWMWERIGILLQETRKRRRRRRKRRRRWRKKKKIEKNYWEVSELVLCFVQFAIIWRRISGTSNHTFTVFHNISNAIHFECPLVFFVFSFVQMHRGAEGAYNLICFIFSHSFLWLSVYPSFFVWHLCTHSNVIIDTKILCIDIIHVVCLEMWIMFDDRHTQPQEKNMIEKMTWIVFSVAFDLTFPFDDQCNVDASMHETKGYTRRFVCMESHKNQTDK